MQTHESPSLVAERLVKNFRAAGRDFFAVNDLSFALHPGESVAFLGPNGAGKSTTIKILCGILTPTSGSVSVLGHTAGSTHANRQIGLVFGTRSQLFMHMTVQQSLNMVGEIYYISGDTRRRRIAELAELFDIKDLLGIRVRILSLGQRMRCEIVAALLHRPRVLLADEPTIGLDIVAKNRLRQLILRWQKEEMSTFLLTSHDLSDVEALCGRCILIDEGVKRYDGPLNALKGDLADLRRVQITVSGTDRPPLASLPQLRLSRSGPFIHCYELTTRELPMSEALARLSAYYGDSLQDISISEVTLEEVLAHRYQERT